MHVANCSNEDLHIKVRKNEKKKKIKSNQRALEIDKQWFCQRNTQNPDIVHTQLFFHENVNLKI